MNYQEIINQGETLTVEFKSDRKPLPDNDLIDAITCMANGEGGILFLGIEDNGQITGLHKRHKTDPYQLAAFIASRTEPPFRPRVTFEDFDTFTVAIFDIQAGEQLISTKDGRVLGRGLDAKGKPECSPIYPHQRLSWYADKGQIDPSGQAIPGATWDDLDPLEFERLRQILNEYRGDADLPALSNEELAGALGLVKLSKNVPIPTLVGLLLVGREDALQRHVPAHEVAFQVLEDTDVTTNEFRRWPLLRIHEWIMQSLDVRNEQQELMAGSFRVGIPRFDRRAIREAVVNALVHRDYRQLGPVNVQIENDHIRISNPGGLVQNVQADKLLVVQPTPRNPALADAFKRIGLVERTGRGVNIIYIGQLRNGRRPPSYDVSQGQLSVLLESGPADLAFVENAMLADRYLGRQLNLEELLVLWDIWTTSRATIREVAEHIQQNQSDAQALLSRMEQLNLITGYSSSGTRMYRFSSILKENKENQIDDDSESTKLEKLILTYLKEHDSIKRGDVENLTELSQDQSYRLLQDLVHKNILELVGSGRAAHYRLL